MQSVERIGSSFWYMTPVSETDRPILGMVVGSNTTLMIDAGNSEDHANLFLQKLAKENISPPDFVVLTHWHWDHIFGLSALNSIVSIAYKETKEEMKKLQSLSWTDDALDERVKKGEEIEFCASCIKKEFQDHRNINIKLPNLLFDHQLELDLGGVNCIIKHVGGDHAKDSVIVYIIEDKILFLGDCIYPDIFSKKRNYTVRRTMELIELLEEFDAETYILSHWKPVSKEEFMKEIATLKSMASLTERFKGDAEQIKLEYAKNINRGLNEDELETLEYFVNGY